jgi:hypothetical protein
VPASRSAGKAIKIVRITLSTSICARGNARETAHA